MRITARSDSATEPRWMPADRWLHQAAELRARLLCSGLASGFPRLEFLRRTARYNVNQHWQLFASRFYPQIHLAVQPLLGGTLRPDQRAATVHLRYGVASPVPQSYVRGSAPGTASLQSSMIANFQGMASRASPMSAKPDFIDRVTMLAGRLRHYTTRRSETSESSLELVVRRLAHQARRVEARLPGAPQMVVHKPPPAVVAAERQETPEHERFQRAARAWDTIHEASRARPAPAPSFSIEQLTDQVIRQIDSRVVAMRERMGRI